jgi:hypothetical protein
MPEASGIRPAAQLWPGARAAGQLGSWAAGQRQRQLAQASGDPSAAPTMGVGGGSDPRGPVAGARASGWPGSWADRDRDPPR